MNESYVECRCSNVHRGDGQPSHWHRFSYKPASWTINKLFIMFLRFVSFSHGFSSCCWCCCFFLLFFLFHFVFRVHFGEFTSLAYAICMFCLLTFITFDEVWENYSLLFHSVSGNEECAVHSYQQLNDLLCKCVSTFPSLYLSFSPVLTLQTIITNSRKKKEIRKK